MDDLIHRKPILDFMQGWKGETIEFIRGLPTVEAVPLEPLCVWLAAYAAPPNYALDAIVNDIDPQSIVYTVNDRVESWKYHFRELLKSGLMDTEGEDG